MIAIIDLSKQVPCDPTTIRKWIKNHKIELGKIKATNGKIVQSLSDNDAREFVKYWKDITTLPKGMITIPDIAKENKVDRKTVRLWTERNNVPLVELRSSSGPPTQTIKIKDAERFHKENNTPNCIPVPVILKEHNTNWRVIKKWAKKNGCSFYRNKSENGGRNNFSLNTDDYKELQKYLMEVKSDGFFYMIQLVPELEPNRIKLGFSKSIKNRLMQHRCTCPNAKLIKKWKCKKNDESFVMRKIANKGCKRIYTNIDNKKTITEVFDCEDYNQVTNRLDEIFDRSEEI